MILESKTKINKKFFYLQGFSEAYNNVIKYLDKTLKKLPDQNDDFNRYFEKDRAIVLANSNKMTIEIYNTDENYVNSIEYVINTSEDL